MAIENTYLLGKNITLGCGFDLQAKAPLDSRQTVPSTAGLQALIDGNAAYEGMIVYDEESKKTYQAQMVDGTLAFREFGINEAELKDLIASETTAAMEFKGVTATLPENPAKGDMYKVAGENINIKIDGVDAKFGDSIVYNGEQWFLIPSGDDIEDTWRPVTDVANDASLTFAAGDKLDVTVASNGTITYSHEAIAAPTATPVGEDEQTRTYIASIETDGHGHITGYKTATENVEDTNTTYEFEGQSDEATSVYFQVTASDAEAAEVIYIDAYSKNETNDLVQGAKDYADGLVDEIDNHGHSNKGILDEITADDISNWNTSEIQTLSVSGAGSNEAVVRLSDGGFFVISGDDTNHITVDPGDGSAGMIQIKHNTHEVVAPAPVEVGVDQYGHVAVGNALQFTGDYAIDNPIATQSYVDTAIKDVNKVEKSNINGNIKIDGSEVVVYTHPDKHAISDVTGLQDALDGKQAAGNYSVEGHKHVKANITDFAHTHVASEITNLDTTIKAYDYATKTEAQAMADAKDEAIAAALKAGTDAQADVDKLEEYVGTFTHSTAKTVVEYINAKTDGIATSGNLEALGERVTTVEGKIDDKANSADVYAKGETFTKDEVNTAIAAAVEAAHTWGSF